MGKFIDMTNKVYGKITINKYIETRKNRTFWECTCDCGKTFITNSTDIRSGKVKSCGCLKIDKLTGVKFGKIEILKFLRVEKEYAIWECKCGYCGAIFTGTGADIKRGHIQSCGCIMRKNLTGQRFGKLTVIKYANANRSGSTLWECMCDCGNICYVSSGHLQEKIRGTKSCGCLTESFIAHALKNYCIKKYSATKEYRKLKNKKTGYYLSYDIYIPNNIYVEVQGRQHYTYIKDFFHQTRKDFNHRIYLDRLKRQHAEKTGYFIEIDLRKIKTIKEAIEYLNKKLKEYKLELDYEK